MFTHQQIRQSLTPAFFSIALFCCLVIFNSLAFKSFIPPIVKLNFSQANAETARSNVYLDAVTVAQVVEIVKDETSKSTTQNSTESQLVRQAMEDLAQRFSIKVDEIKLLEIRAVTWADSSLGCPKKGEVYTQVTQNGFLIRLQAEGRMYFYHNAGTLNPFLCKETAEIVPHPTKGEEFVPPPGVGAD